MDRKKTTADGYRRYGYGDALSSFISCDTALVIGELTQRSAFSVEQSQIAAWDSSIQFLRETLRPWSAEGHVFLEFDIPRLGRRIDAVLILRNVVFVIEFKVGASSFQAQDLDQVVDYALDLKHFHETSHSVHVAPVLVATAAHATTVEAIIDGAVPYLLSPMRCTPATLGQGIALALEVAEGPALDADAWVRGRYKPTPTIVEAAMALYARHAVADISRSDAANLGQTSGFINGVIARAREESRKAICFVTGVGASFRASIISATKVSRIPDHPSTTSQSSMRRNAPGIASRLRLSCGANGDRQVSMHRNRSSLSPVWTVIPRGPWSSALWEADRKSTLEKRASPSG
jgi:hypothetical protein